MRPLLLTALSIITFFTSCDCYQTVRGTIVDDRTGKPLSGVAVYNKDKSWIKAKTDTVGRFELLNISGGYQCPAMTVVVDDKNYKRLETSIDAGGEKVLRLEQLDSFNRHCSP